MNDSTPQPAQRKRSRIWDLIPLSIFIGMAWMMVFLTNLDDNARMMPNMIGKELRDFETVELFSGEKFSSADIKNDISILNLWASWCTSCRAEHKVLDNLAKKGYKIYSINVADTPENAKGYLQVYGNPYFKTGVDPMREITIAMGATGTPETYVIGTDGIIYFHQRGTISEATVDKKIIPIINELKDKQQ